MGFVALAFVDADTDLGVELQTLLRKSGVRAVLLPTARSPGGGSAAQVERTLDTAEVVLMLWSRDAEHSAWLAAQRALASRRRTLLIVRIDSTPLPVDLRGIAVVEWRSFGSTRLGVEAVRSAIANLKANAWDDAPRALPSLDLDLDSAPAPEAAAEPELTLPAPPPQGWDAFALEAPDTPRRPGLRSPPAHDDVGVGHGVEAPRSAPSERRPDFANTGAFADAGEDVAFSRSPSPPARAAAPSLLGRLKTLGARAVAMLRGPQQHEAPPPTPVDQPVWLAASAPRVQGSATSFTAALVAYVAASREPALHKLAELGDAGDRRVVDVSTSTWAVGAPVCVRLSAPGATVFPAEVRFEWNGREHLAAFSVTPAAATEGHLQIGFQVFVADVMVSFIPMQVGLGQGETGDITSTAQVPRSAFASYASKDAESVTQRLSTLSRWTRGLDIFQDCLDLNPGERFKPQLARQIADRDVFLLFWSRQAALSPWVKWEYTTALNQKSLAAILPMPLEDPAVAPPPPEFADMHLRDRYMLAGYALAKIREEAGRR